MSAHAQLTALFEKVLKAKGSMLIDHDAFKPSELAHQAMSILGVPEAEHFPHPSDARLTAEYEAGQRAVRKEMATEDRAHKREGAEPSTLAVQIAGTLKGMWAWSNKDRPPATWVDNVPSAFRITDLADGRQVIVHVMEVNR